MSAVQIERSSEERAAWLSTDDLVASRPDENLCTLASLPLGARLILRGRQDWRAATVAFIAPDRITLSVNAPSGRTYRVRRPPDSLLSFDGSIPILGEGSWRAHFARYDARW